MRLFRHGSPGNEKPGIVNGSGEHFDVSAFGKDEGV
jgi:hypothetical protein